MIGIEYVRTMARYNTWQNDSLYGAAAGLDDAARRADRGAFFKSIHGTLSHILWGDGMWMHRFAGLPKPDTAIAASDRAYDDWAEMRKARTAMDAAIQDWADGLASEWLEGSLTWMASSVGREMTRPKTVLVSHMFNHQTHHRGQVHAMLTAAGTKPDGTDLVLLNLDA